MLAQYCCSPEVEREQVEQVVRQIAACVNSLSQFDPNLAGNNASD